MTWAGIESRRSCDISTLIRTLPLPVSDPGRRVHIHRKGLADDEVTLDECGQLEVGGAHLGRCGRDDGLEVDLVGGRVDVGRQHRGDLPRLAEHFELGRPQVLDDDRVGGGGGRVDGCAGPSVVGDPQRVRWVRCARNRDLSGSGTYRERRPRC